MVRPDDNRPRGAFHRESPRVVAAEGNKCVPSEKKARNRRAWAAKAAFMRARNLPPIPGAESPTAIDRVAEPGKQTRTEGFVDLFAGEEEGREGGLASGLPAGPDRRSGGTSKGAGMWLPDNELMLAMGLDGAEGVAAGSGAVAGEGVAPTAIAGGASATSAERPLHQGGTSPADAAPEPTRTVGKKKAKKELIPVSIPISRNMTGEEFKAAAALQVFGSADVAATWRGIREHYTPAQGPVELFVDAALLRTARGTTNLARGIQSDASGKVAGADARSEALQTQPASEAKSALLAEIDRRYYATRGGTPGSKIKANQAGPTELWRTLRDEVLFEHEYLGRLPSSIQELLRAGLRGRELTPSDYDQLFGIARKLQALPPGAVRDYASKLTGPLSDLAALDASLDLYRRELAEHQLEEVERTTVQNKLLGLEAVYALYKQHERSSLREAAGLRVGPATAIERQMGPKVLSPGEQRAELERQLDRHGFGSISEFASYLRRFEVAFEIGAARVTNDLLARYSGKLQREAERYQDPSVVSELHGKLSEFRGEHQQFEKEAGIWNAYAAQSAATAQRARVPGNGHVRPVSPTGEQTQAAGKAQAARAAAQRSITTLAGEYPIFAEDELPVDQRLDKVKLARANEGELAGVLQAHLAARLGAVEEARAQLEDQPALVYKLTRLIPAFYAQLDIQPGSIHDQILQDKLRSEAVSKLVSGVLLGLVAVALTVVSLGAAVPALAAAGASVGAVGISAHLAYGEYQSYATQHDLAAAGLAEDPSTLWLILAIVGAGVDAAVAAGAVRALSPAAKALEAGGDVSNFARAVEALKAAKQLDERAAGAIEKAVAARGTYAAARGELTTALGRAYSFPGPFTDPEVYRALVRMAVAKIREGGHSLEAFVAELKQARVLARLGELSPEELAKVKEAWGQADTLAGSARSPVELVDDAGELIGRYQHGSQLEVISRKKLYGGNEIKLDDSRTTTITGTLDDTDSIARRGIKLPGATVMGENPGGLNILRSPRWREIQVKHQPLLTTQGETAYWRAVTDEFWETVNKPWLDEAIARGDGFRFVSNPNDEKAIYVMTRNKKSFVLHDGEKVQSIFGREVAYLRSKGYVFKPDGTAVKVQ